jgi:hypothetical protein
MQIAGNIYVQEKSTGKELSDEVFLLLEEARSGQISWSELKSAKIGRKESTIYLARELHFLANVSDLAGCDTLASLLNELHYTLLRKR